MMVFGTLRGQDATHAVQCIVTILGTAVFMLQSMGLHSTEALPFSANCMDNSTITSIVPPSGVYWDNLSVQTTGGNFLLHNCRGFVQNGHVCGVLGPSGAGKSTLLSAIGGFISAGSGLQVNGEVVYYDSPTQSKRHLRVSQGTVAWLQQKDNFFNMLTVRFQQPTTLHKSLCGSLQPHIFECLVN